MKTDEEHSRAVSEGVIRREIELLIDDCRGALHDVEGSVGSHRALMYAGDLASYVEALHTLLYQLKTEADDAE